MTEAEREKVYWRSIEKYGSDAQIFLAIEEMSELTKAILKLRRYASSANFDNYYENMLEEMADVKIMLRQLEMIFDCEFGVEQWIDRKVKRQIERLEGKRR